MIKIIKHGQTEFRCTCGHCGCEFTYEHEDITLSSFVICPDCGEHCYIGGNRPSMPKIGWPMPSEPIPCAPAEANKIDPCKDCDWMKKLLSGITYVGDVPCTWCSKGPYRVTCDTLSGNGTTDTISGTTYTYTNSIGSYTVDPATNEYFSELATASNETNKADLSCNCNNINSCLKRTEVFSNNNCCCEDCCAK